MNFVATYNNDFDVFRDIFMGMLIRFFIVKIALILLFCFFYSTIFLDNNAVIDNFCTEASFF